MKLLNFGSLNLDYVYSVEHFVQPGETLSSNKLERFCGGKGLNQSIAIARAGVPVWHAGKIGGEGGMLLELLRQAGVDTSYVEKSERMTGHAIIQVDKTGQNCILLHGGANTDIEEAFIDRVLAQFGKGDILLLQNEQNNLPYLMEQAHARGLQIACNPSPIDRGILQYPFEYVKWFILNEIEGNALTGKSGPEEIADTLLERYPHAAVVLTLGKQGVLYRDAETSLRHGTFRVKPVDTTGAGDTFTGYFLAGICQRLAVHEILHRASVASSIAVSRRGAAPSIPTLQEVLDAKLELTE